MRVGFGKMCLEGFRCGESSVAAAASVPLGDLVDSPEMSEECIRCIERAIAMRASVVPVERIDPVSGMKFGFRAVGNTDILFDFR